VSSPGFSLGAAGAMGLVIGLLFAALVSLRPDHDPLIFDAVAAVDRGRWYVLVHADGGQQQDVRQVLGRFASSTPGAL
jgi:hypothetical protein